ncbi:MAG: hypothetical protein PUF47_09050 [Prevotella stercorea]|nr:hypothetical protein [Leyella stercorea]
MWLSSSVCHADTLNIPRHPTPSQHPTLSQHPTPSQHLNTPHHLNISPSQHLTILIWI